MAQEQQVDEESLEEIYSVYCPPVADNYDSRQQSFLEALMN